jgi:hypothetical protein
MKTLAGLLPIALLTACAATSASPSSSERTTGSPESTVPSSERTIPSPEPIPSDAARPSAGSDGLPTGMLDDVIALAEEETGIDRSEIEVILAEPVTWSDGSIGCPEEGMAYTQALVPGYRVILDIAGEELAFHAPESGEFFPCASPIDPAEGSGNS